MQELFSEFKKTSAAEWKERLLRDLKGEAWESLVWKNENGFEVQPFYTSEDLKTTYEPAFSHSDWQIGVKAKSSDPAAINKQLLRNLAGGASSISLHYEIGGLSQTLKDIQIDIIHSVFYMKADQINGFSAELQKNHDLSKLHCALLPSQPLQIESASTWWKATAALRSFPHIKTLSADLLWAHNRNCTAWYEVAMILSALNEQANLAAQNGGPGEAPFVVRTGVSTDYFVQIAKLRAVRRLWQLLKKEYGFNNELYVLAESSLTDKSISDNYNNLLRTTLEAMAAVSGGCNELILSEFDLLFATNPGLSERMAVNQQLILKEESYLNRMADTACGSYYIESLTDALAQQALAGFQQFEKEGGYFECLSKGIFDREIAQQAAAAETAIASGQRSIIGVNKFRNEKEKLPLSKQDIAALKALQANNPILHYELEHFFSNHA